MIGVPLPEAFNGAEKAPVYLYIPEYKGEIFRKVEPGEKSLIARTQQTRSQRLLDNAAPARIANAVRTTGTSGVIDLIIENENSEAKKVGIWPQHFLSSNFGNEPGITIRSGISDRTFAQILSAINNQCININMLQVEGEVIRRGAFTIDVVKTDVISNWTQTNQLLFLLSPHQQIPDIIQLQTSIILDFSTSLEFTIHGNSVLFLKLFLAPLKTVPLQALSAT